MAEGHEEESAQEQAPAEVAPRRRPFKAVWKGSSQKTKFSFMVMAFTALGFGIYATERLFTTDDPARGASSASTLPIAPALPVTNVASEVDDKSITPETGELMAKVEAELEEDLVQTAKTDNQTFVERAPLTAEPLPPQLVPLDTAEIGEDPPRVAPLPSTMRLPEPQQSVPRKRANPDVLANAQLQRMNRPGSWVEEVLGSAGSGAPPVFDEGPETAPKRMRLVVGGQPEAAEQEPGGAQALPAGVGLASAMPAAGRSGAQGGVSLADLMNGDVEGVGTPNADVDGQVQMGAQPSPEGREVAHRVKLGDTAYGLLRVDIDSDFPGPVLATVVSEGPLRGARMAGDMALDPSGTRILVNFDRMSLNSEMYSVTVEAVDPMTGQRGLQSRLNRRILSRWGALLGAAFAEGYAESLVATTIYQNTVGGTTESRERIDDGSTRLKYAGGRALGRLLPYGEAHFRRPATVQADAADGVGLIFWTPVEIYAPMEGQRKGAWEKQ